MLSSARQVWRSCALLLVACLLFTPALDALDGDGEDVELVATPPPVASPEKHVPLADVPGDPVPPVLGQPLLHAPTLAPPTWRPPIPHPVRCRPSLRAGAGGSDADADPA